MDYQYECCLFLSSYNSETQLLLTFCQCVNSFDYREFLNSGVNNMLSLATHFTGYAFRQFPRTFYLRIAFYIDVVCNVIPLPSWESLENRRQMKLNVFWVSRSRFSCHVFSQNNLLLSKAFIKRPENDLTKSWSDTVMK